MKRVKDLVERVKLEVSLNKNKVITGGLILGGLVVFTSGCTFGVNVGRADTVTKVEYDKANELISDYKEKVELKQSTIDGLNKDKQELQAKIDSAKDYFELDENEKVLVDQKIEEVNKATEEQEEAERKAKEEEEERAKKEAEEKAEAERIAAEEEAKRQEQERIAAEQQAQEEAKLQQEQEVQQNNIGQQVWITETGSKYHRKNNCGSTDSSEARQISKDEAESMGYGRCKRCYGR